MPSGVFDIVRIDGFVRLELFAAFLKFAGVVVADSTLPEMRSGLRGKFGCLIEIANRRGDLILLEALHAAGYILASGSEGLFGMGWLSKAEDEDGEK